MTRGRGVTIPPKNDDVIYEQPLIALRLGYQSSLPFTFSESVISDSVFSKSVFSESVFIQRVFLQNVPGLRVF